MSYSDVLVFPYYNILHYIILHYDIIPLKACLFSNKKEEGSSGWERRWKGTRSSRVRGNNQHII